MADVIVANKANQPIPVDLVIGDEVGVSPSSDYAFTIGTQDTFAMSLHQQLDIGDISAGTQTNDVVITLDGEEVTTNPSTSVVDSGNSTTTELTGDAVFTGTGLDCEGYTSVTITVHAEVDSATNGMQFQFSTDNTNWDDSYDFNLDASSSQTRRFQFPITAKYFRVKYTNGSGAQTAGQFRVQTMHHRSDVLTSIHRIDDSILGDRSTQLVKSVIAGETTAGGGGFVNVKVNPSGTLTVEAEVSKTPILDTSGAEDNDYKVTLTANTATQVPEAGNVPNYDYVLLLGNTSDTAMVHGNSTGIIDTGAVDKGIPLAASSGAASFKLKADEVLYVACAAAKQLNYTIFSVVEAS